MSLVIPIEQPIKFYKWVQRSDAQAVKYQAVDILDQPMFQFYDDDASWLHDTESRVLVLDSTLTPVTEITPSQVTVGDYRVYTFEVPFGTIGAQGDIMYVGIVDANSNIYTQNFIPGGDMESSDEWITDDIHISVTGAHLVFSASASGLTESVSSTAIFKVGSDYTVEVNVTTLSGPVTVTAFQGATNLGTLSAGVNELTFTAVSGDLSFLYETSGAAASTVSFSYVHGTMDYDDCTPQFISAPFCISDIIDQTVIIHGCANSDYFGMFFETTGFVPQVRCNIEINDRSPLSQVDRMFFPSGRIRNYFVQHVSLQELRIEWCPAYLVNFFSIVFYLDHSYVDNVEYTIAEDINVLEDPNARDIKAFIVAIAPRTSGVKYKRIVNDPDANECELPSGAYLQQGTDEEYQQQGTDETYYAQN